MPLSKRTWSIALALLLSFVLSGCITINPSFRPSSVATSAPPTSPPQTLAEFNAALIAALVTKDSDTMRALMSDPFVIALWQGEANEMTANDALTQLQSELLDQKQAITFVSQEMAAGWLGALDPLSLWPPEKNVVAWLGVSIPGTDGADEAILFVAQDAAGGFGWYAMLLAPGGFALYEGIAPPIIVPEPPAQGILPSDVTRVLLLGAVGIFDGPGASFTQIGVATRGETYRVLGVSPDGQWWAVSCTLIEGPCWLTANPTFVRPVSQPPPGPTSVPQPTVTPMPTVTPQQPAFPIRINFAPGQSSTIVRGNVGPMLTPQYVLFVQANQTLHLLLTSPSPTTNFSVRGVADGVLYKTAQEPVREWSMRLPRSQDYLITLSAGVNTGFVLEVTVPPTPQPPTPRPPTPTSTPRPPAPERINFAPGETSAVRSGSLPASQFKQYVFRALANQPARILLDSPGGLANFALQGVSDGVLYKPFSNPAREFSLTLPRTEDYLISINGPAAINFLLELTISPTGPTPTSTPRPPAPERINFAPGETSAVRSGSLPASQFKQYVFRALANQPARILLDSPGGQANFALQGVSDGVIYKPFSNPAREFSLTLPRTQDYLISINGPALINFMLELTISPVGPTPTPTLSPVTPERITFPPGATSATRSGPLRPNTPRAFIFGAAAGQTAYIGFTSPSPAANFSVRGASDGVEYKSMSNPSRNWSFVIPSNQDYIITIVAPVNTSFTLNLTIPPGPLPTVVPPTETPTQTPTVLPTVVPPTETPTQTPTVLPTVVPPTETPTTIPPTATATATTAPPTATPTLEPTATATNTPLPEPTATDTPTPEPTATATDTPMPEPTATETPTGSP